MIGPPPTINVVTVAPINAGAAPSGMAALLGSVSAEIMKTSAAVKPISTANAWQPLFGSAVSQKGVRRVEGDAGGGGGKKKTS